MHMKCVDSLYYISSVSRPVYTRANQDQKEGGKEGEREGEGEEEEEWERFITTL